MNGPGGSPRGGGQGRGTLYGRLNSLSISPETASTDLQNNTSSQQPPAEGDGSPIPGASDNDPRWRAFARAKAHIQGVANLAYQHTPHKKVATFSARSMSDGPVTPSMVKELGDIGKRLLDVMEYFATAASAASAQDKDPMVFQVGNVLDFGIRLADVLKCEAHETAQDAWATDDTMEVLIGLALQHATSTTHAVVHPFQVHQFVARFGDHTSISPRETLTRLREHVERALYIDDSTSAQETASRIPACDTPLDAESLSLLYNIGNNHWVHALLKPDLDTNCGHIELHDSDANNPFVGRARLAQLNEELPLLARLISLRPGHAWRDVEWTASVQPARCPQQANSSDCGWFTWRCALCLLAGLPIDNEEAMQTPGGEQGRYLRLLSLDLLCENIAKNVDRQRAASAAATSAGGEGPAGTGAAVRQGAQKTGEAATQAGGGSAGASSSTGQSPSAGNGASAAKTGTTPTAMTRTTPTATIGGAPTATNGKSKGKAITALPAKPGEATAGPGRDQGQGSRAGGRVRKHKPPPTKKKKEKSSQATRYANPITGMLPAVKVRKGQIGATAAGWTDEEITITNNARAKGLTAKEAGALVGRDRHSVACRWQRDDNAGKVTGSRRRATVASVGRVTESMTALFFDLPADARAGDNLNHTFRYLEAADLSSLAPVLADWRACLVFKSNNRSKFCNILTFPVLIVNTLNDACSTNEGQSGKFRYALVPPRAHVEDSGGDRLVYFADAVWGAQERREWRGMPPMERNRLSGSAIQWLWDGNTPVLALLPVACTPAQPDEGEDDAVEGFKLSASHVEQPKDTRPLLLLSVPGAIIVCTVGDVQRFRHDSSTKKTLQYRLDPTSPSFAAWKEGKWVYDVVDDGPDDGSQRRLLRGLRQIYSLLLDEEPCLGAALQWWDAVRRKMYM